MADWLKVLIGVSAGFVVGLLSEPLKFWINGIVKKKALRDALYPAIADIYGFILSSENRELRDRYDRINPDTILAVFDHYYATEKAAFFSMQEAQFVVTFFYLARNLFDTKDAMEQQTGNRALITCVRTSIQAGSFDGKRLNKLLSAGPSWRKG